MNLTKKSRGLAFALSFLLGPIGVLYASGIGGLILILLTIATAATVAVPLLLWIAGWAIADNAVVKRNAAVDEFKALLARRND
jgi:hypothetical protein